MREEWTGDVVKRLHVIGAKRNELAIVCGYTPEYLVMVLNGKARFSCDRSKEKTKQKIFRSLIILERRRIPA